jgi:hypothetical protein
MKEEGFFVSALARAITFGIHRLVICIASTRSILNDNDASKRKTPFRGQSSSSIPRSLRALFNGIPGGSSSAPHVEQQRNPRQLYPPPHGFSFSGFHDLTRLNYHPAPCTFASRESTRPTIATFFPSPCLCPIISRPTCAYISVMH